MRRRSSLVTLALAVLLALRAVAVASPETDKADARREFDAGVEADKHKDWAGALDHYLRANDLLEHAFTIFNIATDYERLGKLRDAAEWFRKYLDQATDPNDLAKVRQQLADLEARPGPITIRSVPGGARAFIDDAPVGVTPVTVPAKGGSHRVAIESNGQRSEKAVRVTYGEPQDVTLSLGAQPATLLVTGSPAGATIYVDGQPSGTLPSAQVPVTEGAHEIRVVAIGYTPFSSTSQAAPNAVTRVDVEMQRGATEPSAGTGGYLIGYYLGAGGGGDLGGRGAALRTEVGARLGPYDAELGLGTIGSDTVFSLGARYTIGTARVAPFLGGEYVFTPGSGFGGFAGLRVDVFRSAGSAIALLAQVGAYRYAASNGDSAVTAAGSASADGITAFPITVMITGTFGKRVTPPGSAGTAAGAPQ